MCQFATICLLSEPFERLATHTENRLIITTQVCVPPFHSGMMRSRQTTTQSCQSVVCRLRALARQLVWSLTEFTLLWLSVNASHLYSKHHSRAPRTQSRLIATVHRHCGFDGAYAFVICDLRLFSVARRYRRHPSFACIVWHTSVRQACVWMVICEIGDAGGRTLSAEWNNDRCVALAITLFVHSIFAEPVRDRTAAATAAAALFLLRGITPLVWPKARPPRTSVSMFVGPVSEHID